MKALTASRLSNHIKVMNSTSRLRSRRARSVERNPRNAPGLDAGDDLLTHDALVGVSVLIGGPASPQAADHERDCSGKPVRQAEGSGQFEEHAAGARGGPGLGPGGVRPLGPAKARVTAAAPLETCSRR